MSAVALAVAFAWTGSHGGGSPFTAPPQYFLTGYAQQRQAEPITIPGEVRQPETAMFRIAQR